MDFSPASLMAGFVFGVIGLAILKRAKARGSWTLAVISVVMIAYTYFISSPWLSWGLGLALCFLAYSFRYS